VETLRYGTHPDQVVDLTYPEGVTRPPLVVLLHGGFWRVAYDRVHVRVVADALTAQGFAVANVEYRRVGGGGGWPSTFTDVADAVDAVQLALADRVDLGAVAYVGHSAGGHLALWAAVRDRLPADAPGRADRAPLVRAVVALAPAADLAEVDLARHHRRRARPARRHRSRRGRAELLRPDRSGAGRGPRHRALRADRPHRYGVAGRPRCAA